LMTPKMAATSAALSHPPFTSKPGKTRPVNQRPRVSIAHGKKLVMFAVLRRLGRRRTDIFASDRRLGQSASLAPRRCWSGC
jgi:hypothetical protein